ncbi:histidine kinase [Streptomyces noursei ZPM]|uniref:histidine kinase n=1 Tax=Streptomyces noursei TaxID=1971 RepID=A0A059VUL2_STRNR|nr:putative two-component system sensor kinase [Streptomyces noursei]AKA01317.1 histidine kinase [Streptomyces noursei ZPM]GCB88315.1 two-component sensor histidine kinase [Streptomyces noursei]
MPPHPPSSPRAWSWYPSRSLRWRIAGLVAAATCVTVIVLEILVDRASHAFTLEQSRSVTMLTLDRAAVSYSRTGLVAGTGAELDATEVPGKLRALVRQGRQGTQYTDGPDGPAMWAARPAGTRTLSVRHSLRTTLGDLEGFNRSILRAGLLTILVVLPPIWLVTGEMSRRLRTAAGTARRIAAGDLDARISAMPRPFDEIAEISGAVDSMAASLQARLRSEQRFTADVAHELRTPLMGLVTAAELLPDGEAERYVRDRVRALCALVEDLLEISRLDAGVERADPQHCALVPLLEETVERVAVPATVLVGGPTNPADVRVWTDPRRLERIVANLVVNAHRHGRPPVTVTVGVDADTGVPTVSVRDRGPGFPTGLLDDGPQRFRTGARERGKGHGLGLTIALGQTHVIGATLTFGNAPDGEGAVALVRLPRGPAADPIRD